MREVIIAWMVVMATTPLLAAPSCRPGELAVFYQSCPPSVSALHGCQERRLGGYMSMPTCDAEAIRGMIADAVRTAPFPADFSAPQFRCTRDYRCATNEDSHQWQ